jgi:hypothetical protein
VTGKFWRPTGNLLPFDRDSFAGPFRWGWRAQFGISV